MKLAMTLMVRDEADIIESMIRFHLAQGVDIVIVTDNGSVDGTAEILEEFERAGKIDLRHDPVQRKQQGETVTQMARDAYTKHNADWVLNADADEFWAPVDPKLTLHDVFDDIDTAIQAFVVPVIDMTGPAAHSGTGLQRLIYRDNRSLAQLNAVGLIAHSTHDAAHVGNAEVVVSQGNHFVSLESLGAPSQGNRIEVRHYPWRSWDQYKRKVESAGRAYESQTTLKPSPNHHGMRDYRRLQQGTLLAHYISRHPTSQELTVGVESGAFELDDRIAVSVSSSVDDVNFDLDVEAQQRVFMHAFHDLEVSLSTAHSELAQTLEAQRATAAKLSDVAANLELSLRRQDSLESELQLHRNRRIVRLIDFAAVAGRKVRRKF